MPVTKEEAQGVTRDFIRDDPGALALAYYFREDSTALYGSRAGQVPADFLGGYVSQPLEHAGRQYLGRVDVPLQNARSPEALRTTLQHEVLGHYGINTFAPAEKDALLQGIAAARHEPSMAAAWNDVDRRYADQPLAVRAEEVFARQCETIRRDQHLDASASLMRGQQSFRETCITRDRSMQAADLANIAFMVAQGLQDRSRTQQTFAHVVQPREQRGAVTAGQIARATQAMPIHFDQLAQDSRYSAHTREERGAAAFFKGLASVIAQDEGRAFDAERFDTTMADRNNAARLALPTNAMQALDSAHKPREHVRDDGGHSR